VIPRFASHCSLPALLALAALGIAAKGAEPGLPAATLPGADLFAKGAIPQLRIDLDPAALESLRRHPREFVSATVSEGDTRYPQVGVHLKGSVGSFRRVDDRPALTLDFCQFLEGRKFHGLRRIHLNNSVEDPSCVSEKIGSELITAAGVPAPRVTRALVALNGRELGLYVLKEGFTEDFLACHFKRIGGDLFEPEGGRDIDARMKRNSVQAPSLGRAALKSLAAAALEPDLSRRWQRLQGALDTDRFLTFMAMEVMLGHRDGYCLARNNFRVYHDPESGKLVFIPHGMDQLLGTADLPWRPSFAGLVARSVMETSEGQALYAERFNSLFTNLFKAKALASRVDELVLEVRPYLSGKNWTDLRDEAGQVKERLAQRELSLGSQLARPQVKLLAFEADVSPLSGWLAVESPSGGKMEVAKGLDGVPALRLAAAGDTAASWRTRGLLNRGHYRFEGRCRVAGVKPLPQGIHQGAGLRIAGGLRQTDDLTGDSPWQMLTARFQVEQDAQEMEFICELRASAGEAWFEVGSLRIVKEP